MPVAISGQIWQECFVPGIQALETAITLISKATTLENAQRAFAWAVSDGHSCASGEGGCLDDEGECTWWPSDPLELCCAEELEEYAEQETNSVNQRKLLTLASELQALDSISVALTPSMIRSMNLTTYQAEATKILTSTILVLEKVYRVGRPATSRIPR